MLAVVVMLALQTTEPTVVIYSYQTEPIRLRHCHTWAVFQHGTKFVTISWMPANTTPRVIQRPQAGVNWTHEKTLAHAKQHGAVVRSHGPYPINSKAFDAAVRQAAALEAGQWQYQTTSLAAFSLNCVAAVAAVVDLTPCRLAFGDMGSRVVARAFLRIRP